MLELVKQLPEYKFDFEKIKQDVLDILSVYNWPQIGLTHSPIPRTHNAKLLESVGSIKDLVTKEDRFKETDFTMFNEAYKATPLYEMYKAVPNIGRFRIMTMDGPACYTIHRDMTKRYHYVIDTDPDCIFLFPGLRQQHYIPADGNLYLVDTRYKHTFVNGSRKRRIHLVMDDLNTLTKTS